MFKNYILGLIVCFTFFLGFISPSIKADNVTTKVEVKVNKTIQPSKQLETPIPSVKENRKHPPLPKTNSNTLKLFGIIGLSLIIMIYLFIKNRLQEKN